MKYLIVIICMLSLSGCAINATGVSRDTGERIVLHCQGIPVTYGLSTEIDGETFKGKLISTGGATVSDRHGNHVDISGNAYRAVLFGDKNSTMRCELCGNLTSGVGSCITSDGEEFDVMW